MAGAFLATGCATNANKEVAYDVATETGTAEIRITGTRIKRRVRTDGGDPGLGMPVDITTKSQIEAAGATGVAGAIGGR